MKKEDIIKVIEELETFEPYEECVPPYYLINEMPVHFFKLRTFVNEYYESNSKFKSFERNYNAAIKYMDSNVQTMSAREILDCYNKIDFANLWISKLIDVEIFKDIGKVDFVKSLKKNKDVILFNQIMYAKYSIPKEEEKLKGGVVLTQEEARILYELSIKLRYGNLYESNQHNKQPRI